MLCYSPAQTDFIIAQAFHCVTLLPQSSRHVLKAYGQAGEQSGAGTDNLFQISTTAAACDLIFFPSYLNRMFFSAEASRHKVPGVKVNRNIGFFFLTRLLLCLPHQPLHLCQKNRKLVQLHPWFERPWYMRANQYTHKNKHNTRLQFPFGFCGPGLLWCPSCRSSGWWSCSLSPSVAPGLRWPVGNVTKTGSEDHNATVFRRWYEFHARKTRLNQTKKRYQTVELGRSANASKTNFKERS